MAMEGSSLGSGASAMAAVPPRECRPRGEIARQRAKNCAAAAALSAG